MTTSWLCAQFSSDDCCAKPVLGGTGCAILPDGNGHVDVPHGTTSIPSLAYHDCYSLRTITFPSSLSSVGDQVFRNCRNLVALDFSHTTITSIGYQFCIGCSKLASLKLPPTLTYIGDMAISTHL